MRSAEIVLLVSIGAILYRLWRGPTSWDRLLAYNSAANRGVVLVAVVGVLTQEAVLLDVAVVYASLSFLGVVVLARFMERGGGFR
jgi:multicomponent Na+:H+ antiporter subunit F